MGIGLAKWVIILVSITLYSCNGVARQQQDATLTVGVIAGLITIVGWFVNEFIRKRNEAEKKKIDERIKFFERQIQEFYGPLFNLVNQIVICNHVLFEINSNSKRSSLDKEKINLFFQHNYFVPLHNEFNSVLKTKLYLVEGSELPQSFYMYLRHAIQEHVQLTLWSDYKLDTSDVQGWPYPNELYDDIKSGLDKAMVKYSDLTSVLDKKIDVNNMSEKYPLS